MVYFQGLIMLEAGRVTSSFFGGGLVTNVDVNDMDVSFFKLSFFLPKVSLMMLDIVGGFPQNGPLLPKM